MGDIEIPFVDEAQIAHNPFFAPNAAIVPQLEAHMDALRKAGDSCGARITVTALGVPPGLGEPLFDKLDADIAYAMMGINAVKGVEIGVGLRRGHAEGQRARRRAEPTGLSSSNHAGGVLGGISTGQDLVVAIAVKPTSSIRLPRASIDRAGPAQYGGDPRPSRPVRGHPRHADRRGDAGAGGDGPCVAPPRAVRRRDRRGAADCWRRTREVKPPRSLAVAAPRGGLAADRQSRIRARP